MTTRADAPTWFYRIAAVVLFSGMCYLLDDKLRHIDRQLDRIEVTLNGLPSLQHDVAVLWRRAFGGS